MSQIDGNRLLMIKNHQNVSPRSTNGQSKKRAQNSKNQKTRETSEPVWSATRKFLGVVVEDCQPVEIGFAALHM